MYKQIAENKRKTVFIIMGFVVMIGVIAGLFAWFYRDPWIAVWTIVVAMVYALIQYYFAGDIAIAMTGAKEITKKDLEDAVKVLNDNKERLTIEEVTFNKDVAKISVVGAGMMSNPGVAARMFEALYNARVNINMISTSEIRITVLVDEKDVNTAINAIHDGFVAQEL